MKITIYIDDNIIQDIKHELSFYNNKPHIPDKIIAQQAVKQILDRYLDISYLDIDQLLESIQN